MTLDSEAVIDGVAVHPFGHDKPVTIRMSSTAAVSVRGLLEQQIEDMERDPDHYGNAVALSYVWELAIDAINKAYEK